jgi:hypothetical protein
MDAVLTNGVDLGVWDDATKTFTSWATWSAGTSRPYNDAEIAQAAVRANLVLQASNRSILVTQIADQVTALLASIVSLKAVSDKLNADIGPGDTKTVARETRAVARAVVRIARVVGGALNDTSSGV